MRLSRLFFFAILCVGLMLLDARQMHVDRVRHTLNDFVSPLNYIISRPIDFADWIQSSISSHRALTKENQKLRTELLFVQARLQRFEALKKENSQLRVLLQSAPIDEDKVLVSHLLAVMPDPYLSEIILDAGSDRGVFEGQPVLDARGIVGQVIQVSPSTARVLLLSDNRSRIPVEVQRSGFRGIAVGIGRNDRLSLINVPDTADIQEGDLILTSGLGLHFPPGYPVAKVSRVRREPGEYFSTITLTPAADLNRSRELLLIWPKHLAQTQQIRKEIAAMRESTTNKTRRGRRG